MSYFKQFPITEYNFGDKEPAVAFQDLTAYVDTVDRLKDNLGFYEYYFILEGDRPDQVSVKLYDSPQFYYLFYLMNDNIRERGWPLTESQVVSKAKQDFPNTTITTTTELHDKFKIGQTVIGSISGTSGKIIHRNLDLGQVVIEGTKTFHTSTEAITSGAESIIMQGHIAEYNSIAYFRNAAGIREDTLTPGGTSNKDGVTLSPVTHLEDYREQNDLLRKIKIPRREIVNEIDNRFLEELNA